MEFLFTRLQTNFVNFHRCFDVLRVTASSVKNLIGDQLFFGSSVLLNGLYLLTAYLLHNVIGALAID